MHTGVTAETQRQPRLPIVHTYTICVITVQPVKYYSTIFSFPKTQQMERWVVQGVELQFPFPAYHSQKQVIETV